MSMSVKLTTLKIYFYDLSDKLSVVLVKKADGIQSFLLDTHF